MANRSRRYERNNQAGQGVNTNRFAPLQRETPPDWSELPRDLIPIVFSKLDAVELLMGASLVCRSWREAAREPEAWRRVGMEHHVVVRTKKPHVLRAMAKLAVDRSHGQIESFAGAEFVTDELVKYITKRSSCLKRLSLSGCSVSNQGFLEMITRSPLLEEIQLIMCQGITPDTYQVAPTVCPQLERFMIEEPCMLCSKNRTIRTMVRFPTIQFKRL